MGVPMAGHLAAAGHRIQSYDKRGGGTHGTPRHAAEGADLLITMLPDGDVVREVVLDALPALQRGALNNGVTKDEIKEVLMQAAIYAGVPAAVAAFRCAREVFASKE